MEQVHILIYEVAGMINILYEVLYLDITFQLQGATEGFNIYPRGIRDLLLHMKKKYNVQVIYITENGTAVTLV